MAEGEVVEKWMTLQDDDELPSQIRPILSAKRGRGKLIMLEDILARKKKVQVRTKGKRGAKKTQDVLSSDDEYSSSEEDENVQKFEKTITDVRRAMGNGEIKVHVKWGERVFGPQNPSPNFTVPDIDNGLISRILSFEPQEGQKRKTMAGSIVSSGLLLSWAVLERRCDETTARWIFHQMAHSDNGCLEKGACEILCDLLMRRTIDGSPSCNFEWIPNFEDIRGAFHVYGYLDACDDDGLQSAEPVEVAGSADVLSHSENTLSEPTTIGELNGPPSNIRSLLQFLLPFIQCRNLHQTLGISEAENLVTILLRCQLDRRLLNVSTQLQSCFVALIDNFSEEEWTGSCERLASAISSISSTFVNKLRIAKSLHATNTRLGSLQGLVVLQLFSRYVEAKRNLSSAEDIISIFKSMNIKESMYNFVNLYHLLTLADIYFWTNRNSTKTSRVFAVWLDFLKRCSTQISVQSSRPHAMKVRNLASFLSQKYQVERMQTNSAAQ